MDVLGIKVLLNMLEKKVIVKSKSGLWKMDVLMMIKLHENLKDIYIMFPSQYDINHTMDITYLLPIELFEVIFTDIKDNIINIVSLAYVNKNLHGIVSRYAKNQSIIRRPDCKYA